MAEIQLYFHQKQSRELRNQSSGSSSSTTSCLITLTPFNPHNPTLKISGAICSPNKFSNFLPGYITNSKLITIDRTQPIVCCSSIPTMEMEDKDSAEYGSPGGSSEGHSQPSSGGAYGQLPAPVRMNAAANIVVEKNAGAESSPAVAAGAGVVGGGGAIVPAAGTGKKRGRPRKYDAEGNLSAAYLRSKTAAAAASHTPPSQQGFTLSTPPSFEYSSGPKKSRGKASGFGNWQALAALGELFTNTAGGDFTPHVVTVHTGEDVAGKILTFAQKGSRGVCVLSANGCVSNVTIRQPGSSGGLLTYEGRFEILTLTGSYTISDNGGIRSRTGGLSVSLASPDGRVIGGGVAGLLMAASPIQIVVGSFVPNGFKFHKRKHQTEPRTSSPAVPFAPSTVTAAIPLSQAPPETNAYPTPASHFPPQSQGDGNSLSNKDHPNSTSTDNTTDWNGSGPSSEARPYPDINLSIPVEEH